MPKIPIYEWQCDTPSCSNKYEDRDNNARYMSIPPGWAEISITEINEDEEECSCKCHDEDCDDDGDNVAGHETYDCEVCPEDTDWQMAGTYCPACYSKFRLSFGIPRREE